MNSSCVWEPLRTTKFLQGAIFLKMSSTNHYTDELVGNDDSSENEGDEFFTNLKQGLSISDVQNGGTIFDVDQEKDLAETGAPPKNEYFGNDCIFEQLVYQDDSESESDEPHDNVEPFEKLKSKMTPLTEDGGVMKRIKKPGYGGLPPENAQVTVHYNAYIQFVDEPFDSSRLRNKTLKFILQDGQVLRGLDIGIASMRQSEIAEFLLNPDYAYGKMGCPPRVPANGIILYVVELLDILDCKAAIEFEQMNSDERKVAPFEKVMEVCKIDNRKASEFFKIRNYYRSAKLYNKAIKRLSVVNMANEAEEKKQQLLLAKLYSNLSQCYLNMNAPERAIPVALSALKHEPTNNKAMFRCGKACRLNGDFRMAKVYLQKVARREPSNAEIFKEIKELEKDIVKYDKMEKEFCANIFKDFKPMTNPPNIKSKPCEVSDSFRESLVKNLKTFIESDYPFLPFNTGFSDSEIEAVRSIATDMGLHCVVPLHGESKLRVYRDKPK